MSASRDLISGHEILQHKNQDFFYCISQLFMMKYPKNPFSPLLRKKKIMIWKANDVCTKDHIREILEFQAEIGRPYVWINTGGHGNQDGLGPDTNDPLLGETNFYMEDLHTAIENKMVKVSLHIVNPYTAPVYPKEKVDVIDAWCYSLRHKKYLDGPSNPVHENQIPQNQQQTYTGEIVEDQCKYVGGLLNGQKHGYGVQKLQDRIYKGYFENGKENGYFEMNYSEDGRSYKGNLLNGKANGKGTHIFLSGNKYDGFWKNDMKHGFGVLTSSDGHKEKGIWANNKRNGAFKFTDPQGITQKELWQRGQFIHVIND